MASIFPKYEEVFFKAFLESNNDEFGLHRMNQDQLYTFLKLEKLRHKPEKGKISLFYKSLFEFYNQVNNGEIKLEIASGRLPLILSIINNPEELIISLTFVAAAVANELKMRDEIFTSRGRGMPDLKRRHIMKLGGSMN